MIVEKSFMKTRLKMQSLHELPENIQEAANEASISLLPEKSEER